MCQGCRPVWARPAKTGVANAAKAAMAIAKMPKMRAFIVRLPLAFGGLLMTDPRRSGCRRVPHRVGRFSLSGYDFQRGSGTVRDVRQWQQILIIVTSQHDRRPFRRRKPSPIWRRRPVATPLPMKIGDGARLRHETVDAGAAALIGQPAPYRPMTCRRQGNEAATGHRRCALRVSNSSARIVIDRQRQRYVVAWAIKIAAIVR